MTKRIIAVIAALIMIFAVCLNVSAVDHGQVLDAEHLLSEDAVNNLSERADEIASEYYCNVYIVTYENVEGYSSIEDVADAFFDENPDSILLLISESMGAYSISADGYGEDALTEKGRNYIDKKISSDLKDGNYEEACDEFLNIAEKYLSYYDENGKVYTPFSISWIIWAVVIGVVIAFIAVFIMKGQLKSVRYESAAGNYVVDGSFSLTLQRDIYLYSTVRRVAKPKQNSSSSSGGSRGHTSGSL